MMRKEILVVTFSIMMGFSSPVFAKIELSATPTEDGAEILLQVEESGEKTVRIVGGGGPIVTLHEGPIAVGSHTFDWKAGDKVATGDYIVEVSHSGSPTVSKEFSYAKPKLPSRKSIMPEVTFPSWNK